MSENKTNQNDARLMSFKFNLHPILPHGRCNGEVILEKEKIIVVIDEKTENEIKTDEISELISELGVGCLYISCRMKKDDSVHILGRADTKLSKKAIKAVRKMNFFFEDGVMPADIKETADVCPKCGRPYKPGSSVCLHCVDKSKTIKRLWKFIKPYKWFVFFSVVMFFGISAFHLLNPYLNRIVVDDYITSKNPI